MRKFKKYVAYIVSRIPLHFARVLLYRYALGYRIGRNPTIAFAVVIAVDRFECGDDVIVGRGSVFIGPITVLLGSRVQFGRFNKTECSYVIAAESFKHMKYLRTLEVGSDSLINEGHLFDLAGKISIGEGTWIAGFNSQFLTHGASVLDRDITIGHSCFLGSAVRFAPGSGLADRVILGIGSVVTKRIVDSNVVVAGVPARVISHRSENDKFKFEKVWR
jgi:acetyltransferase-like isoleucine patch superfamily enzyme